MGFFGWKCRRCRLSVVSHYAHSHWSVRDQETYGWMCDAVVIDKDGKEFARGVYDGYGRILITDGDGLPRPVEVEVEIATIDRDLEQGVPNVAYERKCGNGSVFAPEIYHQRCFDGPGPVKKRGPSTDCPGQSYWVDPPKRWPRVVPKERPERKDDPPPPDTRKEYRIIALIDVTAKDLTSAYAEVYEGMGYSALNWESADEAYCEGETIDPEELQNARMAYLDTLEDDNDAAVDGD